MSSEKKIVRKEVRFAIHLPKNDSREDGHYIKEQVWYEGDNTPTPRSYIAINFKRPIWVTKNAYRNHKEKKEFEDIDKLNKTYTTQSDINITVAGLLGTPHLANSIDAIKNSPYVYGYDITSTSLIKYTTLKKNDFIQSPYTVAAFDIETNPDTEEIILATIAFGKRTYTAVLKKFIKNVSDVNYRVKRALETYLPNYEEKYKDLDFKVEIFDNEVDLLKGVFKVANDWAPDFLAIWNMNFDIPMILKRLKYFNVSPIDVICDQSIPRKYRYCRYKEGISKKVTASGVLKPINPSLRWHTLFSTSSFYVIDAMCVYRQLRMAKQEEPSYSLDYILKKELNTQKLKFKEADGYSGLKWHFFMQENYPVEYLVYNMYDCLSMLELDNKIKDLTTTLPSFAGITDFNKFNSNPKKIVDALFLFGMERGRVIGTVAKINKKEEEITDEELDRVIEEEESEEDEMDPSKYKTLSLKGWIQLLPQHLLLHEGLKCLEEYPDIVTNIRGVVCDQDASAAYPSCTLVANVSKETCRHELIQIEGVKEDTFKEMNLSVCLGNANMLEYFNVMFGMPSLLELDV